MCKGYSYGETKVIQLGELPKEIRHHYTRPIEVDHCIVDEVKDILKQGIATWGHSCCGHGRFQSQVFILKEYIGKAREKGYMVVAITGDMVNYWEDDRIEYAVLLKNGTQGKPLA